MEVALYSLVGLVTGGIITWLICRNKLVAAVQWEKDNAVAQVAEVEKLYSSKITEIEKANSLKYSELERNHVSYTATSSAQLQAASQLLTDKQKELDELKQELRNVKDDFANIQTLLAKANANNEALAEKLQTQKAEMEELGKKFNLEFENIANKILETKSEKFTDLNKA
ncbi:MAG: hypothetical protein ACM3ME_09460, partial [Chloroflexota bacterium]